MRKDWCTTTITYAELIIAAEIGRAGGWIFYEHPDFGDEAPLVAVKNSDIAFGGKITVYQTNEYEIPNFL